MGIETLYVREGRKFIPATFQCVLAAARAQLNRRVRRGVALNDPQVRDFRDCDRLISPIEPTRGWDVGGAVGDDD